MFQDVCYRAARWCQHARAILSSHCHHAFHWAAHTEWPYFFYASVPYILGAVSFPGHQVVNKSASSTNFVF